MKNKKSPWKHDPAFYKLIQIFDGISSEIEPPTGDVLDTMLSKIENSEIKSFRPFYENDTYIETLNDMSKMMDFKGLQEQFEQIAECRKSPETAYKVLTSIADSFDPESREYYYRVFEPSISTERLNDHLNSLNETDKKKWQIDVNSDINALMFHKFLINIKNVDREKERQQIRDNMSLEQILSANFGLLDKASLVVNKKSLRELYSEAKNGDIKSLRKLIQFDKTLFDHDWVKTLMLKAMIVGDYDFFEKIAYALKTPPPIGKIQENLRIRNILFTFWGMGLYRLENHELIDLLESSGFTISDDPETFGTFVRREIKPLFPQFE